MKKIYFIIAAVCLSYQLKAQIYVTQNGLGNKDGSSWNDAYEGTKLQQAINEAEAAAVKEVWVAKGTYTPTENLTGTADVDKSFILRNGVKIYGGFIGDGQDDLNTRNFVANETILSGDFGGGVNAHHVVVNVANITGVVLDGFTITGGKANGTGNAVGTVARNRGGGIFLNSNSGVDLKNLIIKDNLANDLGGGVYLYYASAAIYNFDNVEFKSNTCDGENSGAGNAGALYIGKTGTITGTAYITACSFNNNQASDGGGAIYNALSATSTFNKCKFFGNKVTGETTGAGVFHAYTGTVKLYNSVFYANETNSSSIVNTGSSTTKGTIIVINNTFYKNKTRTGNFVSYYNASNRAELKFYNNIFRDNRAYTNVGDFASDDPSKFTLTDIDRRSGAIQDIKNNLLESTISPATGKTVADNINFSDPANTGKPLFVTNTNNPVATDFLNIVEGLATEAGNNTEAENAGILPGTDLSGIGNRKTHTNIDLGAFEYQGTLPVTFDYFKAKKEGATANLTWRTLAEKNSSHFVVQRGSSTANFVDIKRIEAGGNANEPKTYGYIDQNPLVGINYYRLVQYDYNGDYEVLGQQALNFALNGSQNLVYPNPASKYVTVKLPGLSGIATIDLVNLTGQKVISKSYNISASGEITIDLSVVSAGTYILWINQGKANNDKKMLIVE